MANLKQAAATIVEYVGSDNMEVPEELRLAAEVFARARHKTNERLAECDRLLNANLRSEALRQAQLEPDLLALFADLEISQHDQWEEIATRVGLSIPPRLNAPIARRLNQRFAEEESLRDLVREHRLLALSRAPLRRRLDVLRLLAKAEPVNTGWADDVRAYEAARYDELRDRLDDPTLNNTWEAAREMFAEISSAEWVTPPPLDLLGGIQDLHATCRRKQGERSLTAINPRLLQAIADHDLEAARDLGKQAETIAEEFGIDRKSHWLDPLRRAEDWIDSERKRRKESKQFDRAVEQLRSALAAGVDWWYVQEYYLAACAFEEPIPADVARQFASRARVRKWLWLAGAATIVIAVAAAAVLVLYLEWF